MGSLEMLSGLGGWDNGVSWGEFGGEDLCESLEMEADRRGGCSRWFATELGVRFWNWIWRREGRDEYL